jgi:hypothetical protein
MQRDGDLVLNSGGARCGPQVCFRAWTRRDSPVRHLDCVAPAVTTEGLGRTRERSLIEVRHPARGPTDVVLEYQTKFPSPYMQNESCPTAAQLFAWRVKNARGA